jgi:hypothetical protein
MIMLQGVPIASFYIGRDNYGVVTILVGSKGVPILIIEGIFFIRSLTNPVYSSRSRRRLMLRLSYQACGPG